ncbi:MAG: ABC transporter substrate-binding protein [Actinomycetes bacterium]
MRSRTARRLAGLLTSLALAATACAGGASDPEAGGGDLDLSDWASVEEAAQGQTVRWWLFGGDDRINAYLDEHVVPAAAELGVTLERVPITDTADAVQRVLSEARAEADESSVDMIWINGENFAAGKEAGLWAEGWATRLPNHALVDADAVDTDFGVPVEGMESAWSRALFVYAHDTARTPEPPRSFTELLEYARAKPGRVTYPAPPDFTGSAFVRQAVAELGEDEAFALLAELTPLLWREGQAFPENEAELNQLFADGQVDLAMSYDPAFVQTAVAQGSFPETARPFTFTAGTLQNTSYVTIPARSASFAGALVVANLLLDPTLQAIKADPDVLGVPTVLDLDRLEDDARTAFTDAVDSPHLLTDFGPLLDELAVDRVEALEQRWQREVLTP